MAAANEAVVTGAMSLRKRVQLCRLLASLDAPAWAEITVDVRGDVHFRKAVALQPCDGTRPSEERSGGAQVPSRRSDEQAGHPTRRVSPSRARRSADRAAKRAAAAEQKEEEKVEQQKAAWLADFDPEHEAAMSRRQPLPAAGYVAAPWQWPGLAAMEAEGLAAMEAEAAAACAGSDEPVLAAVVTPSAHVRGRAADEPFAPFPRRVVAKATGEADSVKKQRLGARSGESGEESSGEDDSVLPEAAAPRVRVIHPDMYERLRYPPRGTDATPHTASPASDEWPSQPA